MGATDKYQLIVESVSRGDAELQRLEKAVNKLADTTERSQKRSADSYDRTSKQAGDALAYQESAIKRLTAAAESGGHRVRNSIIGIGAGVVATKEIFDVLAGSVDKFTAATMRSDVALSRTLATYRATRLASSAAFGARALLGTAATIGVGLVIEAAIRNAREQADKVLDASMHAAEGGSSFGSSYAIKRAAKVTNRNLDFISDKSVDEVDALNKRLSGIADPIDRSKVAVKEFGKNAGDALSLIDDRLVRQLKRAEEFSAQLDGPTREGLQGMVDILRNFHPFDDLSDGLSNFIESGKIKLAIFTVDVAKAARQAAKDSAGFVNVQGPDFDPSGDNPAFMPKSEKRFRPLPTDLDYREQFTLDARKRLGEQLTNKDTGGFALRSLGSSASLKAANAIISAPDNTADGLRSRLGQSEKALERAKKLFLDADTSQKASFADLVATETKSVSVIEARIKALGIENALREKIANQQREFDHDFALFSGRILSGSYKSISDEIGDRGKAIREGKNKDLRPSQISSIGGLFDERQANQIKDAERERVNGILNEGSSFRSLARGKAAMGVDQFITSGLGSNAPTLRRSSEAAPGVFEIPGVPSGDDSTKGSTAFLAGMNAKDERDRSRRLQTNQQELSFLTRKLELLTGPGGERAAIESIAKLKLAALEEEASVSLEMFNVRDRQNQIERERVIGLAELDKKRRDAGREATGRAFDALVSGGAGGITALGKSVVLGQGRIVAQNLTEKLAKDAGGFLGRLGKASGLSSSVLGGTLFDPQNSGDPLKTATDANTAATTANTAALLVRGGGGAASSIGGVLSAFTRSNPAAFIPSSAFFAGSGTGSGTMAASSLPGFDALNVTGSFGRDMSQVSSVPGTSVLNAGQNFSVSPKVSALNKGVGYAGAALAGTLGAINGFKAGGAQGNLMGASSIAGAAATIIALSPASGPAAPIMAGIALALVATAALIGDPKKNRDRALDRLVSDSRYNETQPLDYAFDTRGGGFDYNSRGDLRSINVQVNLSTLDNRSFMDNREMFTDAVRQAMLEGHGINRTAQEVVLGI